VLVILECDGQEYTIMTHQARVPIGTHNLPEIPAGMLDGSGNFRGVAANELAEECDIVIPPEELIDMTELAYGSRWTVRSFPPPNSPTAAFLHRAQHTAPMRFLQPVGFCV
jgi:hypothetical protein